MAIKQNNKTQSQIRFNLSNILGLSEEQAKIVAQNQNRIYGGYNAVLYNTNGEPCGCGNGGSGVGGGNGGSGGGGSGGGVCICEDVGSGAVQPCCVQGYDCENKQPIKIQLDGRTPPDICKSAMPMPTPEDPVIKLMFANCQNPDDPVVFTQKSSAGAAASALSASILEKYISENCPHAQADNKYTTEENVLGIPYTRSCVYASGCSGCITIVACGVIENENQITDEMREYYSKNKTKHYSIINGKIKDLCNPFDEPLDEITICDENGNQYEVKSDGTITSL